jgi:hypothetical protein
MKKMFFLILVFSLALAACSSNASPTMEGTPISGTYPGPDQSSQPATVGNGYPVATDALEIQILQPQDGDNSLTRGEVFLESTQLLTLESNPTQYKLMITGSLPTPCHQLRGEVAAPDATGKIVISIYSLSAPDQVCAQVLQPFTSSLSLGSFTKGSYTVELNGQTISQIDAP